MQNRVPSAAVIQDTGTVRRTILMRKQYKNKDNFYPGSKQIAFIRPSHSSKIHSKFYYSWQQQFRWRSTEHSPPGTTQLLLGNYSHLEGHTPSCWLRQVPGETPFLLKHGSDRFVQHHTYNLTFQASVCFHKFPLPIWSLINTSFPHMDPNHSLIRPSLSASS